MGANFRIFYPSNQLSLTITPSIFIKKIPLKIKTYEGLWRGIRVCLGPIATISSGKCSVKSIGVGTGISGGGCSFDEVSWEKIKISH